MYFTKLPNHSTPHFDEQLHFSRFKKQNIIFNAVSKESHCDNHVGCLSFKTVLNGGEEWYGVNNRQLAVRPGQFLILNNDQNYSCHIEKGQSVRTLSVFFKKEFASTVFRDAFTNEETLLNNPFRDGDTPEFFQTLRSIDSTLLLQLKNLVASLEREGYSSFTVDEYLVFLLNYLVTVHQSDSSLSKKVNAVKSSTKIELYKRLCIAKDFLHSYYHDKVDLNAISAAACLSVPQLVRQFKSVFHTTPHQYLMKIRVQRAAELLKNEIPVNEIAWCCGFENLSAFCRAFKSEYRVQPGRYLKQF